MSRKQAAKARPGKAETERKRDERAARRAQARERRNRPPPRGEGEGGLAAQLQALGLRLREVPGDGNCLFRALGDQLEGHSRDHLKHRQETVDYMIKQREDFEPFVEDDVPFDKHVANLAQPGTFAGNDAIVAFARNNQLNVVIHQLNAPLWQICGTDKSNARELHIAYRYGEHYDSVRKMNDNSEAPARLQMETLCRKETNKKEKIPLKKEEEEGSEEEIQDEIEDAVQKVRNATGCLDVGLIMQILETEDYNIESAIFAILQMNEVKRLLLLGLCEPTRMGLPVNPFLWIHRGPGKTTTVTEAVEAHAAQANRPKPQPRTALWEENGTRARISGGQTTETEKNKPQKHVVEGTQGGKRQTTPKISNKQRKDQQRLEKKRRQEDRHRQKVQAGKSNNSSDQNQSEPGAGAQITVVRTLAALNI